MKKFTKILVCLMLCVFGFGLVACGDPRTKKEKNFTYPSASDHVYGNGGLAVRKGNYLYFVNGYNSVENISNKQDSYNLGSLMLMKLDENGNVVRNDAGLLHDDYFITMSDKLCGYQATNLFISGDYLYFVTPSLENESGDKVWAKERVVFSRIKLDKSSEVEEVYSAGVKFDKLQYQYYEANGKLYILVWEQGESYYSELGADALVRVDASAKSSSVISNDVKDVVFADNYNEIFFMKHSQDDEYYFLKQYNIASNETSNYTSFEKTFDVVDVQDGRVFITIAHGVGSSTDVKSSEISNKAGFELLYGYSTADSVKITPNGNIVLTSKNVITLVKNLDEVVTITDSDATKINIIDFTNGCIVYYDANENGSSIKFVSYSNALAGTVEEISTVATVDEITEDYDFFDLDENKNTLYFYSKDGSSNTNYYLFRVELKENAEEIEMVGVYNSGDEPVQEETEEEIEEE